MRRTTWWQVLALVAVLAVVLWEVASTDDDPAPAGTLPDGTVSASQLPVEARETLALVDDGGPYPYDRDDSVFMNRERLLPERPRGYWREYTVPTPGESDRGARRLVVGRDGETYYTDDHYASFHPVRRGTG